MPQAWSDCLIKVRLFSIGFPSKDEIQEGKRRKYNYRADLDLSM